MIGSKLSVKNFLGLNITDLEIGDVTIFIGPQASGKSVIAKLLYFIHNFKKVLFTPDVLGIGKIRIFRREEAFYQLFSKEAWGKGEAEIIYQENDRNIFQIKCSAEKVKFILPQEWEGKAKELGELMQMLRADKSFLDAQDEIKFSSIYQVSRKEILYVPAARAFFATLYENVFTLMSAGKRFDPILVQFGTFWELARRKYKPEVKNNWKTLLKGDYQREDERDVLKLGNSRKVYLSAASSGQQELLPLLMGLRYANDYGLMIIEEPEAHIFPDAQAEITKMIVAAGQKHRLPMLITTHSPYVLSAMNNIILGNQLKRKKGESVHRIDVKTYGFDKGKAEGLMDAGTGLIVASYIDEASDKLGEEFERMCQELQVLEEAEQQ